MAITLRSRREIDLLRNAGAIVAKALSKLQQAVEPGISTGELDDMATAVAAEAGAATLFKGVESPYASQPFPGAICASINEQVVHGIPSHDIKLSDGDILSVDFGVKLNGYCGDSAMTMAVGNISPEKQRLMDVTQRLLDIAVETCKPGVKWSEVAGAMEKCALDAGFSVVEEFVGHGIGTEMHEEPKLQNFVNKELLRNDIMLKEGMILAVEPMVNMGKKSVKVLKDGWTVVTRDRKPSAHFEHTIAVVKGGCEVLTAR
ncbi:Methionine aminopeptidase 1 [Anaerohalosphaera lusitana]|uniref:Methionine aminopeptidase n=1 Tax=Anaerohalosphaera lusitana TaxID=1936003 RepID=A0A1U9NPG8_9BACT|nr:type I methionyl aminopeptidase [Anaerohalosphaera lusitana]AQT69832.1 Methionine aminopeptidase 1 [Anaerohalosphaera lusitana]